MSIEILEAKAELKDLVDTFSNLADVKDAKSQGELFLPDGWLEFQMGLDGEINKIESREALVQAFAATINPCKAVYHINGQHTVTVTAIRRREPPTVRPRWSIRRTAGTLPLRTMSAILTCTRKWTASGISSGGGQRS